MLRGGEKQDEKQDSKDSKIKIKLKVKVSSSTGEGNPDITKYISLLQDVLQELADNVGINLDYFEVNLNNYLMFKPLCKKQIRVRA